MPNIASQSLCTSQIINEMIIKMNWKIIRFLFPNLFESSINNIQVRVYVGVSVFSILHVMRTIVHHLSTEKCEITTIFW